MSAKENLIFAHDENVKPGKFCIFRVREVVGTNYKMEMVFEGTLSDLTDSWIVLPILHDLDTRGEIVFMYNPADGEEMEEFMQGLTPDGEDDE